jgi:MFS transporter, DHA1 family, multidrug resistance protein
VRQAIRRRPLGQAEFTSLLALSMALAALGIDLMLPAFSAMRADLGLAPDSTAISAVVTAYFLGLAAGQVVYGPLADRFGRRPILYLGYGVYAFGALAATLSPSLSLLVIARFVWGLGAAGPRVITLAAIRDTFEGERMSRAMSFVMAVFILVPVIAPTVGAAIVSVVSWRYLFGLCIVAVAIVAVWGVRMPETLRHEDRLELSLRRIGRAAREVVSHRETIGYTFALTALYGVFLSYIGSAEIIFSVAFGRPEAFPFIFGGLGLVMGAAMLLNARVVGRLGTRRLAHGVLVGYVVAAAGVAALAVLTEGQPPLWAFLIGLGTMVFSHALLIPNLNTIAMAPMGAIAGTASSVIGSVQLAVGAALGAMLDRAFDGTVLPISLGFLGYGLLCLVLVLVAERGRLFEPLHAPVPTEPPLPPADA